MWWFVSPRIAFGEDALDYKEAIIKLFLPGIALRGIFIQSYNKPLSYLNFDCLSGVTVYL